MKKQETETKTETASKEGIAAQKDRLVLLLGLVEAIGMKDVASLLIIDAGKILGREGAHVHAKKAREQAHVHVKVMENRHQYGWIYQPSNNTFDARQIFVSQSWARIGKIG